MAFYFLPWRAAHLVEPKNGGPPTPNGSFLGKFHKTKVADHLKDFDLELKHSWNLIYWARATSLFFSTDLPVSTTWADARRTNPAAKTTSRCRRRPAAAPTSSPSASRSTSARAFRRQACADAWPTKPTSTPTSKTSPETSLRRVTTRNQGKSWLGLEKFKANNEFLKYDLLQYIKLSHTTYHSTQGYGPPYHSAACWTLWMILLILD